MRPMLSIIMPVLNEGLILEARLRALQFVRAGGAELIMIDGGSTDDSVRIAEPLCTQLCQSKPGRATQMNQGAALAQGEYLLFLHADTVLSKDCFDALSAALASRPVWGRFDVSIEGAHPLLPLTAAMMNWRTRWTSVATGDQGIFVSTERFRALGGFPEMPLMEDVALSKMLRRADPPARVKARLLTNGRRWDQGGWLRTVLCMWGLRFAYWSGINAQTLARYYMNVR
jgi:rSAM/selenodomain-associated transferase 2